MIKPNFVTKINEKSAYEAEFIIEPLPQSFGYSLGNALRRTLLSAIPGLSITQVKVKGVNHIFTTIPGVKESVLEIVMNLKQLVFKNDTQKPFKIIIESKKLGKVLGKDVQSEVEIINKELYIAEITDKTAHLEIEAIVEPGIGFLSTKEQEKKANDYLLLDTYFSPVKKVNFKVEEARVGRKTNYDRLIIEVITDGSITPMNAFKLATETLGSFLNYILSGQDQQKPESDEEKVVREKQEIDSKYSEIIIDELNLPSRIINALLREKIETVADLMKVGREKLENTKGLGKKSIELINQELKKMGTEV